MNASTMIQIGDVLTRPKKDLGFITHMGVVLAQGLVLQNTPERGEHVTTLQDFSDGEQVMVQRTGASPSDVIDRAQTVLANPQKYHPVQNNCEHTATKIVRGIAHSPQAFFWCMIAFVIICVLFFVALIGRKRPA